MAQVCPISQRRVDMNLVRIVSFQIAICTILLLVSGEIFFGYVMLFDFTIRALRKNHLSLFHMIGSLLLKSLDILPKMTDEAPKRFALYLGLVSSLLIVIAHILGYDRIFFVIGTILFCCALLEFILDFCVGCKLYYFFQLLKKRFK